LGLPSVTFYGVGAILGAGIYVLIGEVAAAAGVYTPLSFLLAAVIAVFSAFSYAELSARYPRSAGEAVYVEQAFGRRWLTCLTGLLVIFTGIVSAATMATGIVGYLQIFVQLPDFPVIALFVIAIGAIASWGIEESAWVVMVITLLEVAGLVFVIWVAGGDMLPTSIDIPSSEHGFDFTVVTGILLGSFLAFYAYIGFEDMVNIAEEVRQPETILPKAILLALVVSTLLYMAVSYAAISVIPAEQLASSSAPLADVVTAKGYSDTWIGLISLIAVVNGAIVQLIMASRVIYGMASTRLLPLALAEIHPATATPVRATLLTTALVLVLALLYPLAALAQATSVIVLSVFALVNMALIWINARGDSGATIHYPAWIPWVGAILCVSILLMKLLLSLAAG
jgi:amino acid transporter